MSEVATKKHEFVSRPKPDERLTRAPLAFWDRTKFLILFAAGFWLFVWIEISENPIISFADAVDKTIQTKWWLFLLFGLELVHQLHYLVSEHWSGYHLWWTRKVVGGWNRRLDNMNDWTRYRVGRATKWIVFLVIADIILAKIYDEPYSTALLKIFSIFETFVSSLGLFGQLIFSMFFLIIQFAALFWFMSRGGVEVYYPDDVRTRFADVWGQDAVLEKVKENLIFLEDPKSIEDRGGYVPGGMLLYGPPGTGKTLIAEAVAGETGNPYVFVEPGAFANMFMGVGALKVRGLFRKLRKLALKYGGVIVFFDEADALGNRGQLSGMPSASEMRSLTDACNGICYLSDPARQTAFAALASEPGSDEEPADGIRRFVMGGMGNGGGGDRTALTSLLAEISGLKKPRGFINRHVRRALNMRPKPPPHYRILMMMATNMPDSLDAAFLRPGRIDRIYKVGYPSKEGRIKTYEGYLAKITHELTPEQVDKLAVMSPHATGATIKDMVNESLVNAIRDGREVVTWPDMLHAKHHKEHGLPDEAEYISRERHAVAIHEACHALAFYRLHRGVAIDVATIERRGDIGGFVAPVPLEDQFFTWKSQNEIDIMISLASLAGERMFFDGDNSVGVGGDLRSATRMAMNMEAFAAMGHTVASHLVTKAGNARQLGASVETGTDRQWLETPFGGRVETRLQELLEHVRELLVRDRVMVLAVAHAMERYKTINGEDITAIMEGGVGPVVDGRPYHDPRFVEELEAYHRAALKAHKDLAPIQLVLPLPEDHAVPVYAPPVLQGLPRPAFSPPPGWRPPALPRERRSGPAVDGPPRHDPSPKPDEPGRT